MNKFKGILFCTDLNGTLYKTDNTVSKENLQAIEYFKSEGGLFTFITGRMPVISNEVYDVIHPNAPYGCINGGGIFDGERNKFLWAQFLDGDFLELIREVDEKLPDMGINFNTEDKIYFIKDSLIMQELRRTKGIENLTATVDGVKAPIMKVTFGHHELDKMETLKYILHNHPEAYKFDFILSEKYLYELLPKGVSKGKVLLKMAELLNIEKTVAVGDYNNDVSMLKAATCGFAVENAVPEAKQAADYITVSNDDHAIKAIVDMLDKGEITLKCKKTDV